MPARFGLAAMCTQVPVITGDRGVGGNNSSESSTVVTPTARISAGSTGILCVAADNANGSSSNFPSTITDSAGNIWELRRNDPGGAVVNGNLERATYMSDITTALTASSTITITYTAANVVAKAWTLIEAVPAISGNIFLLKGHNGAAVTTTGAPSFSPIVSVTGDLYIGMGGAESADTWVADSDTLGGSWSTMQHTGFGSGITGMSIITQWKYATTNDLQVYSPTLTSADMALSCFVLAEAPPKARASAQSTTGQATTTVTMQRAIASGSIGVLCWSGDNAGTGGASTNLPATLTDSKSNTWTLQQNGLYDNGAASAGVEIGIYTAPITTPLVIGDTVAITYTIANVGTKEWFVFEFSDATAYTTGGLGTGATTGTPSVTTTSITSGHYVIGLAGLEFEASWVADSDTSNGSWSTAVQMMSGAVGSGAAATAGITQYKKVTGTGTQTYNPTCTSGDTMIGWIELTAP